MLHGHLFSLVGFSPPNSLIKGVAERAGGCELAEVGCVSETDIFESELVKSNKERGSVLLCVLIGEARAS